MHLGNGIRKTHAHQNKDFVSVRSTSQSMSSILLGGVEFERIDVLLMFKCFIAKHERKYLTHDLKRVLVIYGLRNYEKYDSSICKMIHMYFEFLLFLRTSDFV
jgi:hypothetical protein